MARWKRDDAMGAMARWKRDDAMGAMTRCSTGLALHTRREFLGSAAAAAGLSLAPAPVEGQGGPIPIIDTHIHLFDPTRPQGAPYSGPRVPGQAPIAAYPDRYRTLAVPLGAVGAIKVEASPWVEDNLWVLEVAQRDTIIVGVIGNLEPDKPEFKEYFDRYRKHPLFRGIRYGNLWNRDIGQQVQNPAFIEGLKLLADADLVLDTANPRMTLLQAMVTVNDKVPNLRIVLDHLPNFEPTEAERPEYLAILKEIGQRPQMYVKLSAILRRVDGKVSTDLAAYRAKLDLLVATFGEDRIVFGSDWPNSDGTAPVDQVFRIAKEYFATQPRRVAEKYFWRNSISVYKWIKREPSQPTG
jgi:predicted TIM-barrel fold metal-dependent hydrolase